MSQDPYVIERYKEDRLTHGKISFQMGKSLFEVGDKILEGASKIELPFHRRRKLFKLSAVTLHYNLNLRNTDEIIVVTRISIAFRMSG